MIAGKTGVLFHAADDSGAPAGSPERKTAPFAPTVTVVKPTGNLATGTTSTELEVTTNEAATCRLGTTATFDFSTSTNLLTASTTVTNKHTATLTPLANGNTYIYYAKCRDTTGNITATGAKVEFTVGVTSVTDATVLTQVIADDEVLRGESADIAIKLGSKDFIAVIANISGDNFAKTVYYYCHDSYTGNCPTKQTAKLSGPRTISVNWSTLGVNPGNYDIKVSARVDANTLYRDARW